MDAETPSGDVAVLVVMGVFYFFILFFYDTQIEVDLPSTQYFQLFWVPVLFMVPLLTMKSLAEERRQTVAEVRVSQDRIDGIEDQLRLYVDAITQVLDSNRGTWGQGMYFTGGYEVNFDAVQHGGSNFVQAARVSFELDLSS